MKIKVTVVMFLLCFVVPFCLFFIRFYNFYSDDKSKIVEDYFEKVYDTDATVFQTSFVRNDSGFTGGLYQYCFDITDKSNGSIYKATYMGYYDLSEETVNDVKFVKK